MKKKLLSLMLTAAMTASIFAGCGNGTKDTAGKADQAADDVEKDDAAGDDGAKAGDDASAGGADGDIQVGIVLPTKDEPRWLQDQAKFESILGEA